MLIRGTRAWRSPLLDQLWAGALHQGEDFLLLLVGDLELVECRLHVAAGGVELGVRDVLALGEGAELRPVVTGRAAGLEGDELGEVLLDLGERARRRLPLDAPAARQAEAA